MSELPLILAVDEDAEALQRITAELQRYARDYRVTCGPSTEAALAQLEALRDGDAAVAVVLAARGTQRIACMRKRNGVMEPETWPEALQAALG